MTGMGETVLLFFKISPVSHGKDVFMTVFCDYHISQLASTTVGWRSQICYGPAHFVKRKEWRRVQALHEVKDEE